MKSVRTWLILALLVAAIPAGTSLATAVFSFRHSGVECTGQVRAFNLNEITTASNPNDWGVYSTSSIPGTVYCPVAVGSDADAGAPGTVRGGKLLYSLLPNSGPFDCKLQGITTFPGTPNASPSQFFSPSIAASPTGALTTDGLLQLDTPNGALITFGGPNMTRLLFTCTIPSGGTSASSIKAMIKGYEVLYTLN
jgi:hypothetical protein